MTKLIGGFSKLSKNEKIDWLSEQFFKNPSNAKSILKQYWNSDERLQNLHDDFIENTISNFYLPYGVAPNFLINGKEYAVPMAIEESSVVAAASLVAKFWSTRGGFKAEVLSTTKIGQVHFMYEGIFEDLAVYFKEQKSRLIEATKPITRNMEKRGGGILDIELIDKTASLENYYQLYVTFETKDSMGANFINSCLETIAKTFEKEDITIVMSILSNYVKDCVVRAEVSCNIDDLEGENPKQFAEKFYQAVRIAEVEPYRAVTHNKGIMNGIDAVVLATGNDFRAIEAGAHAYAAKDGKYTSLSHCTIDNGVFRFWIELPLALGTVGGLTALHPLAKLSLDLLQNPTATELMEIIAAAGLAQNFAALRALTTKGIQHGHMKMHLQNILNQHNATKEEQEKVKSYFENQTVSHAAVIKKIEELRNESVQWVNFLKEDVLREKLSALKNTVVPEFGKMNAQQMVEHLTDVLRISNGENPWLKKVPREVENKIRPFLDTNKEIRPGFKAPFLQEKPAPVRNNSIDKAIEELILEINKFKAVFKDNAELTFIHPVFGDLNYNYWKKFHTKHFTYHFKQFKLM